MSWANMILTNSGKLVFVGFQPSKVFALVGSPNNCSTSQGRKYLGSISTRTLPLFTSILHLPNKVQCQPLEKLKQQIHEQYASHQ